MPRTLSSSAHQKALQAAIELMSERGIDATSMDAIALLSGVSKATIYKHWSGKEALLLEVMAELSGLRTRPQFDSGNTSSDMVAVLSYKPDGDAGKREKMMPHLMAYSARNPEFGETWRNTVMEPPRRELRHLLAQGIRKGEIVKKLDVEFSLTLLLGPIMYWHIFLRKTVPDQRVLAQSVVEAFFRAFGRKQQS